MMLILPISLSKLLGWIGWGIWVVIFVTTFYFSFHVDRHKKNHNIQTYKKILAFTEGKSLSEIEQAREKGNRPYQKGLIVVGCMLFAFVVTACIYFID